MITPEIKDRILEYLCDTFEFEGVCVLQNEDIFNRVPISLNELEAFFRQLVRMRLAGRETEVITESKSYIYLYLEAQDFLRIGGFIAKEATLKQSIEKLHLEMQKLRQDPSLLVSIAMVITVSIIFPCFSFFVSIFNAVKMIINLAPPPVSPQTLQAFNFLGGNSWR